MTVASSSTPLLHSQLPFQSPFHPRRSPCSRSLPYLLLSVREGRQTTSAPFELDYLFNKPEKQQLLIAPSCGKDNPSPLNPSLQISGTCWRRCVCPSHAAPSYVSDRAPPGRTRWKRQCTIFSVGTDTGTAAFRSQNKRFPSIFKGTWEMPIHKATQIVYLTHKWQFDPVHFRYERNKHMQILVSFEREKKNTSIK